MGGFRTTVRIVMQDEYQTVCPVPPTTWAMVFAKRPVPTRERICVRYMMLTARVVVSLEVLEVQSDLRKDISSFWSEFE